MTPEFSRTAEGDGRITQDLATVLVIDAVPDELVDELSRDHKLQLLGAADDPDELLDEVAPRVRALVTTWQTGFSRELLDRLPALEMVSVYGTGDQALALDAARERDIVVANTADDGTDSAVADLAMAHALALARRVLAADRFVRDGRWRHGGFEPTVSLGGRTAGIVGLGFIGRQIARRAASFGMDVAYHDVDPLPGVDLPFYDGIERLALDADFLFTACRGGSEADGMIDSGVLHALGRDGYLVHIAQARFYDETDLIAALRAGVIAGAAIDIFPSEPDVPSAFLDVPNVLLSPHVGTNTTDVLARRAQLAADNVRQHFAGTPVAGQIA